MFARLALLNIILILSFLCRHESYSLIFQKSCLIRKSIKSSNFQINLSDEFNDPDFKNRVRLKEEIASPLRKLRYFIYVSIIGGGGLGFVTTIPQVLFAIQDKSENLQNFLTNLGINFTGVVAGILFWIRESNDENIKLERFAKAEMKKTNSLSDEEKSLREQKLAKLPVEIQFSLKDENATRVVSFKDLQEKGNQNVVVMAGSRSFVRDAIMSAKLEGNDFFSTENVIIIPVVLDEEQLESSSGKGFGDKESVMTAPYIAKPAQVNAWQRDLQEEVKAAKKQGMKDIVSQGLVLLVKSTGKVVRRGVGIPLWKNLKEDFRMKTSTK